MDLPPDRESAASAPAAPRMDDEAAPSEAAGTGPFRPDPDWLEGALWHAADDDLRPYALIDGSWCSGLYGRLLNSSLSWCSLYQGQTAGEQLQTAPFLLALEKGDPVVRWLLEEGWGEGWGFYCLASTRALRETYRPPDPRKLDEMRARGHFIAAPQTGQDATETGPILLLRQHFRRFTEVEFEDDGRLVLFRFYDPAVLRTWLMSCNEAELGAIFGPVWHFLVEAYNELPSLNRPYELHHFSLRTTEEGGVALVAAARDLRAGVKRPLALPPPSGEKAGRAAGPHVMMRNGQIAAFRKQQLEQFQEQLAVELAAGAPAGRTLTLHEARDLVTTHVPRGRGHGLTTRDDLANFTICALRFGPDFPERASFARDSFKQAKDDPSCESALSRDLARWAEDGAAPARAT